MHSQEQHLLKGQDDLNRLQKTQACDCMKDSPLLPCNGQHSRTWRVMSLQQWVPRRLEGRTLLLAPWL